MNKIEKIAGEIMHLIYKEYDRCGLVDSMRPHSKVLKKLYKRYEQKEMNDAFALLANRGYTKMRGTERGQICWPSDGALSRREELKNEKTSRTVKLCAWGVGIIFVALGLLMSFLKDF